MPHVIEAATSGRAKCRGCGGTIQQGTLRFGERIANPFGGGEATLWFHLQCAAYRRPEALLEILDGANLPTADAAKLRADAQLGIALHRLPRIDGVGLSTGARARCRDCHEMIVKGEWRIPIVFFAEGAFHRRGFVHVGCASHYFETSDLIERLRHFQADLDPGQVHAIRRALEP
jgi:Poly(ADP-ribose) polymerase and DNA-Ligase Zn-finger region